MSAQTLEIPIQGTSMGRNWPVGTRAVVALSGAAACHFGDVIVFRAGETFLVHRVIGRRNGAFRTRGDANGHEDRPVKPECVLGPVLQRHCPGRQAVRQVRVLCWVQGCICRVDLELRMLKRRLMGVLRP